MFSSFFNCLRFERSLSGIAQTDGLGRVETATSETFYRDGFRYCELINSFVTNNSTLSQLYDGLCFQKVPYKNCPPASHLDVQHIITSCKCESGQSSTHHDLDQTLVHSDSINIYIKLYKHIY